MKLNLNKRVVECLKEAPEKKLEAKEIAEWIFETYKEACLEKKEKSKAKERPLITNEDVIQQIAAEIGSKRPIIQKNYPEIKTTEGRPRKYYFSDLEDSTDDDGTENQGKDDAKSTSSGVSEDELYAILSDFLLSEFKIYSDRINENSSPSKKGSKGKNEWLHPDVVGIEVLNADWCEEIKECVKEQSGKVSKLWSFEVKIDITRSNVRKHFFQTVSNSSWANLGYLVAGEIAGSDTMKELAMLCSLHGIGFIKLNIENPAESQILIPANEKSEVDWDATNRLAINNDFKKYITKVSEFYQIGKIKPNEWYEASEEDE